MMEHNKVRQLLIDCREALSTNQNLVVLNAEILKMIEGLDCDCVTAQGIVLKHCQHCLLKQAIAKGK